MGIVISTTHAIVPRLYAVLSLLFIPCLLLKHSAALLELAGVAAALFSV